MKYIKKLNIDFNNWDDYDDGKTYKNIPYYKKINGEYNSKDEQRIHGLYKKTTDINAILKLSNTMANRITNIVKAIKRGNAALHVIYTFPISLKDKKRIADVFYKRAEKLYYELYYRNWL